MSVEDEIGELRNRIRLLEETLQRHGIVVGGGETNSPEPLSKPVEMVRPVASLPPAVASTPPQRSLENRIGSQWFNRVGILAVLIGVAWFLKLAVDNQQIGPLGRVTLGVLAGAGLIAWSERFRIQGYIAFAYSLKSIGSGILYLTLWAAFSLFHILSPLLAFAGMVVVTAFNGLLAWRQNSELLALYAIVGGFAAPLLVPTGDSHELALFAYLLLLNLALLLLVASRSWPLLLLAAFASSVLDATAWWWSYYSADRGLLTGWCLSILFVLFAVAPRLVGADQVRLFVVGSRGDQDAFGVWNRLATALVPVVNAGIGFLGFYWLLGSLHAEGGRPWLALLFAAFYLLLALARGKARPASSLLADVHLALVVVFLVVAVPLATQGRWLTILWLTEGTALVWVASRTRTTLPRILAAGCLGIALIALLLVHPRTSGTPFLNQRFVTYMVAIAAFACTAWIAGQCQEEDCGKTLLRWPAIAAGAGVMVNLLILTAGALEIHAYWSRQRWPTSAELYPQFSMRAQFTYSAFFMAFGAVLLVTGFARGSALLRWQALALLVISIGKVFLVDVSRLREGYRILSFLGLGGLLLAVSFVYQRDWFNLRGGGGPAS